jgi:DNA integrity scanning protein DisA with diadenylate cyclase activity
VVSEETGSISYAFKGELVRDMDRLNLKDTILKILD